MPSSRFERPDAKPPDWLTACAFAHRGLHGDGRVENSRSAFLEALALGYGIELDVRLSRDGFAVVFHDGVLARLTSSSAAVHGLARSELNRLRLGTSGDRIEELPAILKMVAGRVPLLIELKTDDDPRVATCLSLSVRHALEGYRGAAAVMSFDPAVGSWFARHAPGTTRGLVVSEEDRRSWHDRLRRILSLRRAHPHFLGYDVRSLPSRFAARARRRGLPVLAWTVRTSDQHRTAAAHADQIIFEN